MQRRWDPEGRFLLYHGAVPFSEMHAYYQNADAFVFASSCENLPNILLEAMAAGLPIACSDRGPMPEVLGNGGVYFDPLKPEQIAAALRLLIDRPDRADEFARTAYDRARTYSWTACARDTFGFIAEVAHP